MYCGNVFNLSSETVAIVNGKLWVADICSNRVFEYDLNNHFCKVLLEINEEDDFGERLFSDIVVGEEKVFLIPFNANNIYEVDIRSRTYKQIEIKVTPTKAKFGNGFIFDDELWLVCTNNKGLVRYSLETKDTEVYTNWVEDNAYFKEPFFRRSVVIDGVLYAASFTSNYLLKYRLDSNTYEIVKIRGTNKGFSATCVADDLIVLISVDDNKIITVQRETECQNIYEFDNNNGRRFANAVFFNGKVYFLPLNGEGILVFDIKTNAFNIINSCYGKWFVHFEMNSELYLTDVEHGVVYRLDDNELYKVESLTPPSGLLNEKMQNIISQKDTIQESFSCTLQDWVNVI